MTNSSRVAPAFPVSEHAMKNNENKRAIEDCLKSEHIILIKISLQIILVTNSSLLMSPHSADRKIQQS